VLTSGGDAPGMNACLRAVVRAGLAHGMRIFGIGRVPQHTPTEIEDERPVPTYKTPSTTSGEERTTPGVHRGWPLKHSGEQDRAGE